MNKLKFSVSMCVYGQDNPNHFKTAVDSILNQTLPPDEIVLVVDGPVPIELDEVIREYETSKLFNVIRLKENQGHGNARRIGLDMCKNELVALMDADDISLPERFSHQIDMFLKDPDLTIVGGNISEFFGEESNIVSYRNVYTTDQEIKADMKKRCPFNQITVMFKKEKVEAVGGYIDWYCDEDYYLWLRLMLGGAKFANSSLVLANVRIDKKMFDRRGGLKYFKSEAKLQKYMLDNKIININTYLVNIIKRFVVQVLSPNCVRKWLFKRFARKSV